jgi:hypothetical protein
MRTYKRKEAADDTGAVVGADIAGRLFRRVPAATG